jgi:lipid-A-disaccharide synthase
MDDDLIYIVAGEQSGDVLGARLIAALRAARPGLRFAGIGGPLMAAEGVQSLFPLNELAVMGLLEVLPRIMRLRRLLHQAAADVATRRPAVLVTIDSPGFTLRLLKLVGASVKRVHYVAPQVWAWREHRVKHFPGLWDRLLCLLPFEPAFFARHGLPAVFVGHPVLQSGAGDGDGARFRAAHGLSPDAPVLVVMPGSRRSEVAKLLPVLAETLTLLTPALPGLVAVVPVASAVAETVRTATAAWPVRPVIVSELGEKHDAFAAAAAAVTKSGTSTLELALAGVPMVVTYRVNPLTAMIARRLVKIRFAAMVNLLADRELVPELIQQDSTPEKLAAAVRPLLADPAAANAQRAAVAPVLASLAAPHGTPSEAAAAQVLALLDAARPG